MSIREYRPAVANLFTPLVAALTSWRHDVEQRLASQSAILAAEEVILQDLLSNDRVAALGAVSGAGFIAQLREGHLSAAWWRTEHREGRLDVTRQRIVETPDQNGFRTFTRNTRWSEAIASTAVVFTGPYIDYIASGTAVLSLTLVVHKNDTPLGIVGIDVSISGLEQALDRRRVGNEVLALTNLAGRVIYSTQPELAAGTLVDNTAGEPVSDTIPLLLIPSPRRRYVNGAAATASEG